MADSETVGGGGTFVGGEVGGGARAMVGGSLPPRKRLLAGLKQNGLWPATSSQALPSAPEITRGLERGARVDRGVVEVSPGSAAILTDAKGSCVSCGALESNSWTKVKRNGAVQRVCNSCAILLNKSTSCLHCQVPCPEVKDPSTWMQCHRCQRTVHLECENKSSLSCLVDTDSFVCFECTQVKAPNEIGTSLLGSNSHGYVGIVGVNWCLESGNCASTASTECLSPRNKKPRVSKEPRSKSSWIVGGDADLLERVCHGAKTGIERKGSTSQETAVAAAEEVAALAGRTAAKAKATAAVKAAAAVRAAAVAKAALDVAALAARADAQARAELCRSSWLSEHAAVGGVSKYEAAHTETRKEKLGMHDDRIKGEDSPGVTQSSIDDEELARQLHRVINSSPRISRGLAPQRRKPAGQPGAVSSVSDSVRVISRSVLSIAAEPRPFSKQQQARPRSMCQKDARRLEPKFVKHEVKTADTDSGQNSSQQLVGKLFSDNAGQLIALKTEPTDSSTVAVLRQESVSVQRHGTRGAPEILPKPDDTGHTNGATRRVFDEAEGNEEVVLGSAASQAAAMLDEVLMSEANAEEVIKGADLSESQVGMSPNSEEELHALIPFPISKAEARQLEGQQGLRYIERKGSMGMCPGVATLAEVASSETDTRWTPNPNRDELELDPNGDNFGALMVKFHESRSDELTLKIVRKSSEVEDSSPESLAHAAVHGKPWQRGNSKGFPGGGQGFGSGLHTSPIPSASPIRICTPTTSHS